MSALAALERFLERLFERPSARLFHTRLQPVQLQRRIERAMEGQRLSGAERTLVPNRFQVRLHPVDLEPLQPIVASLANELADGALQFARAHRYVVLDRPQVDLVSDSQVREGETEVLATFVDPVGRKVDPAVAAARERAGLGLPAADRSGRESSSGHSTDGADDGDGGHPSLPTDTMVFIPPTVDAPAAVLREIRTDGSRRSVTLDQALLTIGRASDNGLVVRDSRASRYHARLQARSGILVLTDLGSTNGTRVNGFLVDEVVLGEGDRVQIGDTVLVVESLGATAKT